MLATKKAEIKRRAEEDLEYVMWSAYDEKEAIDKIRLQNIELKLTNGELEKDNIDLLKEIKELKFQMGMSERMLVEEYDKYVEDTREEMEDREEGYNYDVRRCEKEIDDLRAQLERGEEFCAIVNRALDNTILINKIAELETKLTLAQEAIEKLTTPRTSERAAKKQKKEDN